LDDHLGSTYTQYRETGQINWRDVGKDAAIGAVTGGIVGLTLGTGAALTGGAGGIIFASHLGAAASMASGVAERSMKEQFNGGNGKEILEAGFNGDAMLMDGTLGSMPYPTNDVGAEIIISVASSTLINEHKNNISTVEIIRNTADAAKTSFSPTQTSLKSSTSTIKKCVNLKADSFNQKIKKITGA